MIVGGATVRLLTGPDARAYDALIVATAIAHDLPLYTVNPGDFAGISDLRVVAVPHPDTQADPGD